jgi:hypothetical protein
MCINTYEAAGGHARVSGSGLEHFRVGSGHNVLSKRQSTNETVDIWNVLHIRSS